MSQPEFKKLIKNIDNLSQNILSHPEIFKKFKSSGVILSVMSILGVWQP